jgi:hypothetical protein
MGDQPATQTQKQISGLMSLVVFFFQNKDSRLKMDLRKTGLDGMYWIHLARDRDQRRALVNTIMNLRVI